MTIGRREIGLLGLSSLILFLTFWALSYALIPHFSVNRWDNFEYYTPTIFETHRLWWHGLMPNWSPWQHLGEPLFANGQPGALYFPYTLIVGLFLLFHLSPAFFTLAVILSHGTLMAWGWSVYLRHFKLSRHWALTAGLAASTCGVILCYETFWIFSLPYFALLPWCLLGLSTVKSRAGVALTCGTLTLSSWLGHPQFTAYFFVVAVLYLLCFVGLKPQRWGELFRGISLFAISVLAALPALLPIYEVFKNTHRSTAMPKQVFLEAALPVENLLGLFMPFFHGDSVVFKGPMLFLSSAPWLLPALILGVVMNRRRPQFLALFGVGLLVLLLSLGKAGGILPLTFGLPIWSSFRWPHKFAPFALPLLVTAAAFGGESLEAFLKQKTRTYRLAITAGLAGMVALCLSGLVETVDSAGSEFYLAGVVLFLVWIWWVGRRGAAVLLLGATLLSAVGIQILAQQSIPKLYQEDYASVGARELSLLKSSRVLPVSKYAMGELPAGQTSMQEHGIFQSATINKYESATGHTSPLAVDWYLEYLPSSAWGLLPETTLEGYLTGGLLSLWSVDTLLVDLKDSQMRALLSGTSNFFAIDRLEHVEVYRALYARPKFWLADSIHPFQQDDFLKFFADGAAQPSVAFIEDVPSALALGHAQVMDSQVEAGGEIRVSVDTEQSRYLIMNYTYYPQWKAYVNGVPTPIHRANGLVMALEVPRGQSQIRLKWISNGFRWGLAFFGLALILFTFTFRASLAEQ